MARRRRKRTGVLWTLVFFAVSCGIVWTLFYAPFFNISRIYVVGYSRLTEEEIIAESYAQVGDNIFRTSISEIKQRVRRLPYVKECNAKREFPNRIKIWVRESAPEAIVRYEEQDAWIVERFAVTDASGKVLEVRDEIDDEYNIPVIDGLLVDGVVPGKVLAAHNKRNFEIAIECVEEIVNNGLLGDVVSVDVSDIDNITLNLQNRIEVNLRESSQIGYKLMLMNSAWRPPHISEYERGRMIYTNGRFNFIPR